MRSQHTAVAASLEAVSTPGVSFLSQPHPGFQQA